MRKLWQRFRRWAVQEYRPCITPGCHLDGPIDGPNGEFLCEPCAVLLATTIAGNREIRRARAKARRRR